MNQENIPEEKKYILTYHFLLSPPVKYSVMAKSHAHAEHKGMKLPRIYMPDRLNEIQSFDIETVESHNVKEEDLYKKDRIKFIQEYCPDNKPEEIKIDDIPF